MALCLCWKYHQESAALARLAFHLDRAVVRLHDPAHHCKAQPGAASLRTAAGRVDTVETVENPIDVLWRDANAVILGWTIGYRYPSGSDESIYGHTPCRKKWHLIRGSSSSGSAASGRPPASLPAATSIRSRCRVCLPVRPTLQHCFAERCKINWFLLQAERLIIRPRQFQQLRNKGGHFFTCD